MQFLERDEEEALKFEKMINNFEEPELTNYDTQSHFASYVGFQPFLQEHQLSFKQSKID